MASLQAFHLEVPCSLAGRGGILAEGEVGGTVEAACAANAEFAFFFGVEIQQDITLEQARLEAVGTGHPGLFVIGDQGLYRTVLQGFVLEY